MPEASSEEALWRSHKTGILVLAFTLLVVLVCCLVISHIRLFWSDELLEYYADIRPSLSQVIRDQIHAPLSLDAPLLHVVLHGTLRLIPSPELAARLPSMLALLLVGGCAYLITWRFTGRWPAALVATLLAIYLVSLEYGAEARSYAMLAGWSACATAAYTYVVAGAGRRWLCLAALALALFLAVTTHFYGAFVVLPFCGAELIRSVERRHWDWPVSATFLAAGLGAIVDYPFTKALGPFREHYFNTGQRSFRLVPFTYAWTTSHARLYWEGPIDQAIWSYAAMLLAFSFIAGSIVRMRRSWRKPGSLVPVEVALCVLALFPVLDFLIAQITRANEPRYSVAGLIGLAVLGALLASEFFVLQRVQLAIAGSLLFALLLDDFYFLRYFRRERLIVAQMQLSPEQAAEVASLADQHIYVQDIAKYLVAHTYAREDLRRRLIGFHDLNCELQWTGRDVSSLFARNFQATTPVPFVDYSSLLHAKGPHLVLIFHDPMEEWIAPDLEARHARIKDLGYFMTGSLYQVEWPEGAGCHGA